ncbi:MAG TPA: riboflavin synthase [Hyphomonadaceae bacterium]|nr:riboflavin synthase [Hyphomonadaceae bacterium]
MFTGLVSDVGKVTSVEDANGLRRVRVEGVYPAAAIQMGASIQHSGVCLTVVEFGERAGGSWWVVEAIPETLSRTTLGQWQVGSRVNLELSLKLGDELGGHLVYGHVDGLGELAEIRQVGESRVLRVRIPEQLAKFFAEKGSVTIDGVSLTVSAVSAAKGDAWFEVSLIPHTLSVTTLGELKAGDRVNLEVDMLARYVARMLEWRA